MEVIAMNTLTNITHEAVAPEVDQIDWLTGRLHHQDEYDAYDYDEADYDDKEVI